MSKICLMILDGWGIGDRSKADAVFNAQTPFIDSIVSKYPSSTLVTHGKDVGLPEGQMGNSEVGHLNIGAGRVVHQELSRINLAISDGSFFKNEALIKAFNYAETNGVKIHLIGLVSNGGVHSSMIHLKALLEYCLKRNAKNVFIHGITDGRDCDPHSAIHDLEQLAPYLNQNIRLSTLIGRFYAMDRDQRWERIQKAYRLYVHGEGLVHRKYTEAIQEQYSQQVTDEFLPPLVIDSKGIIEDGDLVINFNFRTDRPREITEALTQKPIPDFDMFPRSLYYVTMTNYDPSYKNIRVLFDKEHLKNTLGEALSAHQKKQVRIAETEKYPHVTYFFNGGRETPFPLEHRLLVNSPKVKTYDLAPEMSAPMLVQELIPFVKEEKPDFICINFANPDMVGHTGVYSAIVKAIEAVDQCAEMVINSLIADGYGIMLIADHGNAEVAINKDGTPNTAHSTNLVPCIFIDDHVSTIKNGRLADVAPTILNYLNIPVPTDMTGISLI